MDNAILIDILMSIPSILFLIFLGKGKRYCWFFLGSYLSVLAYRQYEWGQFASVWQVLLYSIPMCFYNYYVWGKNKSEGNKQVKISTLSSEGRVAYLALCIAMVSFTFALLTRYTPDSSMPVLDAISSTLIILSFSLLTGKKIESWICYIVGDIVRGVLFSMGSWILIVLSTVFVLLDIKGTIEWYKELKLNSNN